jgi:hypothetical protein
VRTVEPKSGDFNRKEPSAAQPQPNPDHQIIWPQKGTKRRKNRSILFAPFALFCGETALGKVLAAGEDLQGSIAAFFRDCARKKRLRSHQSTTVENAALAEGAK